MAQSQWDLSSGVSGAQPMSMYQQNMARINAANAGKGWGTLGGPGMAPAAGPSGPVGTAQNPLTIGGDVPLPPQPGNPAEDPNSVMAMLKKLLANPGDVASNPAYKFLQEQGSQALSRQLGATGNRFSGNALTAAEQYGQGIAGQYFGNLAGTLNNAANTELNNWNVGNQAWGQLANAANQNYATNVGNAGMQNQALNNQYLNQASAQGYGQLMPTVQQIASQLSMMPTSAGGY